MPLDFRQFFMVGVCGGYTTFSSFSLQTLALRRDMTRATLNVGALVLFCLIGYGLAQPPVPRSIRSREPDDAFQLQCLDEAHLYRRTCQGLCLVERARKVPLAGTTVLRHCQYW